MECVAGKERARDGRSGKRQSTNRKFFFSFATKGGWLVAKNIAVLLKGQKQRHLSNNVCSNCVNDPARLWRWQSYGIVDWGGWIKLGGGACIIKRNKIAKGPNKGVCALSRLALLILIGSRSIRIIESRCFMVNVPTQSILFTRDYQRLPKL